MRMRNLALADRDQSRRRLDQSLAAAQLSDSDLLDALRDAQRRGDLHSLELLAEECSRRCEADE